MSARQLFMLVDEISIINIRFFFNVQFVMLTLNKIIKINYFYLRSSECDFFLTFDWLARFLRDITGVSVTYWRSKTVAVRFLVIILFILLHLEIQIPTSTLKLYYCFVDCHFREIFCRDSSNYFFRNKLKKLSFSTLGLVTYLANRHFKYSLLIVLIG